MDDKEIKWFQSKGIWTGIVTGLLGIYATLAVALHWPQLPEWIFAILGAMGIYTRTVATAQIKPDLV